MSIFKQIKLKHKITNYKGTVYPFKPQNSTNLFIYVLRQGHTYEIKPTR